VSHREVRGPYVFSECFQNQTNKSLKAAGLLLDVFLPRFTLPWICVTR